MSPRARIALQATATVLAMLAIYALGFHVRTVRFESTRLPLDVPFWMESAQRYRYVEMRARGEPIPNPDTRMWAPDGYDPRSDTILQEQVYGGAYRLLGMGPDLPVTAYVRTFTRVVYGLGIFALVALCGVLGRSRVGALLACLAYAVVLPAVDRSTGQVLYREHLAIPLVVFHLYFLAMALDRERIRDAVLCGLFLLLAMLSWKVMTFYLLILMAVLALGAVVHPERRAIAALLVGCLVPVVAAGLLLPVHLHHDRVWASGGVILGVVAGAVVLVHRRTPMSALARLAWLGMGTVALALVAPEASAYSHAWETVAARVTHLGHKPADPTELSFHARHFWSGNYRSPTLARLVRDFALPVVAALPGFVSAAAHVARRRRVDAHAAVGLLLAAFGAGYLVFRKLQAFPAMLLAVFIGLGWTAGRGGWRWASRALVVAAVAGMVAQAYGWLPESHRLLGVRGPGSPRAVPVTQVYTGGELGELVSWLRTHTGPDDAVLADFVISPFLLVQADRPVVLNCFFESPMVERYRAYTEALFADEPTFEAFCRDHQVDWVVHAADQVLRVDDEMSYRYVAAATGWDPSWPAAMMQYQPERLAFLELAYESTFFRVYRVVPAGAVPAPPPPTRGPLFSRALAVELWGDPACEGWPRTGDPADALYDEVQAQTRLELAARLLAPPAVDDRAPEGDLDPALRREDLQRAVELVFEAVALAPYDPDAHRAVAALAGTGVVDEQDARRAPQLAEALERALAGEGPFPIAPAD